MLQARQEELRSILHGNSASGSQNPEDGAENADSSQQSQQSQASLMARVCGSALVQVLARSANGFLVVSLYFMDVYSDVQVVQLLVTTKNFTWAAMSITVLVLQFMVVYVRVLPYLSSTFGSDSSIYRVFLVTGFPVGLLCLDFLMFMEPFGLLVILPFPAWLRQFIPAYKATRIIAEVLIESLPQCILQAYIYVVVLQHVEQGTAKPSELAMVEFASLLPRSILISILATLKTWIELVHAARQAGLTVAAKGIQLWNVGAGLPLDALKKGAISEWTATYTLDSSEVMPLLDALGKNSSLVYLDLAASGLRWGGVNANGAPLIEMMATGTAALANLKTLIVSHKSGYQIPVLQLRAGSEPAMSALRQKRFLEYGGPWREEILLIGDLLRKDLPEGHRSTAKETIAKLLGEARRGRVNKETWETTVAQLIVEGQTRRGYLQSLVGADTLRDVGFQVLELLGAAFTVAELRLGGFTGAEMKAAGRKAAELRANGYTAGQLKKGGYTAAQLKAAEYTITELKEGGFAAKRKLPHEI